MTYHESGESSPPEIEVTPEMVEAGSRALSDYLEGSLALSNISAKTMLVRALEATLSAGNYRVSISEYTSR